MINDLGNVLSSTNKWLIAIAVVLLVLNIIKELSFKRWAKKYYTFMETEPYLFPVSFVGTTRITLRDGSVRDIREFSPYVCKSGVYPDERARKGRNHYTKSSWNLEFLPASISADWYSHADEKYFRGKFDLPADAVNQALKYFVDPFLQAFDGDQLFVTFLLRYEPGGKLGLYIKGREDIRFACSFCASSYTPEKEEAVEVSGEHFSEERRLAVVQTKAFFPITTIDKFNAFLGHAKSLAKNDSLDTFSFHSYISPKELIEHLNNPGLESAGFEDVIGNLIYDATLDCNLLGKGSAVPSLGRIAIDLSENMSPKLKELIAATILYCIIVDRTIDAELQQQLFARLVPKKVTVGVLAFNLACFYSHARNKELLLKYADIALDKGFGRRSFQLEKDFLPYRRDVEFKRLLNKTR